MTPFSRSRKPRDLPVEGRDLKGIYFALDYLIQQNQKNSGEKTGDRYVPVEEPGTEFKLDADLVIIAMGFTGAGNSRLINDFGLKTDSRGNLASAKNGMTEVKGVFTAGDMNTGQSLIVRAIHSARKTASEMIAYLKYN